MPRKLTPEQAAAMSAARKTKGAGTGRPPSRKKHCPCGKYTRATAKARYHVCEKETV